jgi:hypothetical protein
MAAQPAAPAAGLTVANTSSVMLVAGLTGLEGRSGFPYGPQVGLAPKESKAGGWGTRVPWEV